ncbi:MAG: aminomethyl-transferring glycine dehydrogenase subunit GcvPB [Chlamydiota bacterium]|nr:aminomethyl-transferring glycine dehydrogenase subunit GcvPB [Chlamydiota bacterium]
MNQEAKTIFEKSQKKQHAYSLPKSHSAFEQFLPNKSLSRKCSIDLPEISELDITRHYSNLAKKNMGIDTTFYPLGSCTMKLNPRVNEMVAAMPEFTNTHPLAPQETVQGNLEIAYRLIEELCKVCGMTAGTLTPNAGAQGEFTGIKMIAAYHRSRNDTARTEMLIPDNAHGTNPATAKTAGFKTVPLRTNENGDLDIEQLKEVASERTAGLMLTNPNTLGLFSPNILEASKIIHENGGLLYYDGANLNPILNVARPGDMGFDVMHINLHKTFSTPHGGGGPGSGPVLCNDKLKDFLPVPRVYRDDSHYRMEWSNETSIGHISTFGGNFAVYLRAYLYLMLHGHFGLRQIAEKAVLNANYLKCQIAELFTVPFSQPCMHEFVVQADNYLDKGVKAYDIAKRLLDYGYHAPTVYFPLIIKECMLIEPTETESKDTLDAFIDALKKIVEEIKTDPDIVKKAPHQQVVTRLDEKRAAKNPILKHQA